VYRAVLGTCALVPGRQRAAAVTATIAGSLAAGISTVVEHEFLGVLIRPGDEGAIDELCTWWREPSTGCWKNQMT